jgi:histidine decarboxylase
MKDSQINSIVDAFVLEMKGFEHTYLGFPNNMQYSYFDVEKVCSVYVNNCGDPFSTLSWKKHSKKFEREVVNYFLQLYDLPCAEGWGYVTSGGTEGNMEGMLLGREAYPEATCYFSEDSHYSIKKIARILRMKYRVVKSLENGEMDYDDLHALLKKNTSKQAIIVANCGTTVKGAFDNLSLIQQALESNGFTDKYIHVDAALSGMINPFIENAPFYSFRKNIDSIAISLHKFLGVPLISGIFLVRKQYMHLITAQVEYVNSQDATITGSRNGHASIFAWYIIEKLGTKRFKSDAKTCICNAKYLQEKLSSIGVKSYLNQFSTTVYFPIPSSELVQKWQLSCSGPFAHVVVMPHVSKTLIDQFIADFSTRENYIFTS